MESNQIIFKTNHIPALQAGTYNLTTGQKLHLNGELLKTQLLNEQQIEVQGNRFTINPLDVHTVFPPVGSIGDHSNVLPHIALKRSTLPWEWDAFDKSVGKKAGKELVPWMGLLVLGEDDFPEGILKKTDLLKNLKDPINSKQLYWKGFTKYDFEDGESMVSYIDLDSVLLDRILPTQKDLTQLAHLRQKTDHNGEGDDHAFIMGNRLPAPGEKCTVHLISLEGRFDKDGKFLFAKGINDLNGKKKLVRLISLKSWSFHCVDTNKSLIASLKNIQTEDGEIDSHTLRLPIPEGEGNKHIKSYLSQSYVPVPHAMRMGSKTISWYRGPLIATSRNAVLENSTTDEAIIKNADSVLAFNPDIGMFDTSYAAAWELGRMLILSEKELAQELYQWKRQHKQDLHKAEQLVVMPHLPFHDLATALMEMPTKLGEWLDGIRLLKHLPFNYLLPDEGLLPKESLRFFQVDEKWIEVLLDGIFSIGRVPYKDKSNVDSNSNPIPNLSGVLLRSDVVSGWPDLKVDGYATIPKGNPDGNLDPSRLSLLRMEKITDTILLCIFDGKVETVDIHLKPEAVHFGFNRPIPNDKNVVCRDYYKDPRGEDGTENESADPVPIVWRNNAENSDVAFRVVDMSLGNLTKNSADFALQMVEGVSKVRYTIGKLKSTPDDHVIQLHPRFKNDPTVKDIYTQVEVKPIAGAESYSFKLVPTSNSSDILMETSKDHKFQFAGITSGTKLINGNYTVSVDVMKNGVWSGTYKNIGTITLNCPYLNAGGHLHSRLDLERSYSSEDYVYARRIPLAQGYKFTFDQVGVSPPNRLTKTTKGNRFKLKSLKGGKLVAGTYNVTVQLKYDKKWDKPGKAIELIVKP